MSLRLLSVTMLLGICVAAIWTPLQRSSATQNRENPPKVQDNTKLDEIKLFMRAKLTSSQKLLEGLVVEDFAKIKSGAKEMRLLSKGASWPQADDKTYNHFNTAFRIHCEKIEKLAEQKNLEGVKFTYLQLTTSCVDCHSYVRGRFKVKRPLGKKGPVQLIPTYWDDKK